MTLKSSGIIYLHGDGSETNDANNQSIVYEVWKYIPTSDYVASDVLADAKDSSGTLEGFNSLADFAGWARHNSKVFVTILSSPYGAEFHSSDHTEPDGPGDQCGSDISNTASEVEVCELWGTETPSGDSNDMRLTLNGNQNFVSGDGYRMRYQTRSRYSGTWGSFGSYVDPYLSVEVTETMRDNDIHFELERTLGTYDGYNDHSTDDFVLDVDGQDTAINSGMSSTGIAPIDASGFGKWQDSGGSDIVSNNDLSVTIKRQPKGGGSWTTVFGPSLGYDSDTDKYSCDFGTYNYEFRIDEI